MESSSRKLKQSGMDEKPSVHYKKQSVRYPSQFEDISVRSDVNENEIATFVQRAAVNAMNRAEVFSCTNNVMCDIDTTIEDCPQNQCYTKYLDPNYDILNVNEFDPNKRVFYDNMKDVISSSRIAYQDELKLNPEKSRLDELLSNKNIPCDYNQIEKQAQIEDLQKAFKLPSNCTGSNPNACDPNIPTMDCPNRECYKKYLSDITGKNVNNQQEVGVIQAKQQEVGVTRSKQQIDYAGPLNTADHKKKYNTLVVNSDVVVPDFIDVLVVMSETPIKIMLPQLQGPKIESTVGKVSTASNLLIKNLSLCSHQIVADGSNKIDTVRTSVAVEPAGKKTFGAIHDTWILL